MINISVGTDFCIRVHRASVSGRMDVYYAQKIAKYVQNPEVDVRIRPNFEARRRALITGELHQDTNFRKISVLA